MNEKKGGKESEKLERDRLEKEKERAKKEKFDKLPALSTSIK